MSRLTHRISSRILTSLLLAVAALNLSACTQQEQSTTNDEQIISGTEWPLYRGNYSGTGYSPLDALTPDNVASLQVAWRYSLRNDESDNPREPNSQATPIVTSGMMFVPTVDAVVALNPVSGSEIWRHQVTDGRPSRRGV
ncbi:MAG: hypothetical protein MI746_10300, partial [Pseudomonadales bacterium]|nr:hypothetical protein [Pseudomonadales bacterium]